MSTYLVAMIVCDFDRRVSDTSSDVEVAVWARRDAIEQTEYARGIAARILRYFEVFFDVPYPLYVCSLTKKTFLRQIQCCYCCIG